MGADQELLYKVKTSADTSGAEAATKALENVEKTARAASNTGQDTAKALGGVGEEVGNIQNAGRALGELATGNLQPLANLGAVIKGIGVAIRTNPLFLIGSLAATVVVPAIAKIREGFEAAKKKAEESSKASNDALETARQAISERRRNETAERFREIASAADEARRRIDLVTQAEIARIDAEEAVAVAKINAAEGLTDVQRAEKLVSARQGFRERRDQRQLNAIDEREKIANTTLERARDQLPDVQRTEDIARRRLEELRARTPEDIQKELEADQNRLRVVREGSTDLSASEDDVTRLLDEADKLERDIGSKQKELAEAQLNYAKNLENASAELAKATDARAAAEAKVTAALEAKAAIEFESPIQRGMIINQSKSATEVEGIELAKQQRDATKAEAEARAARDKRRAEISREALDTAERDGSGADLSRFEAERRGLDAQDRRSSGLTEIAGAARETAASIQGEKAIDVKEAVGGIITIGKVFVAVQGQNRQEFQHLNEAIAATSEEFKRELAKRDRVIEQLGARVSNLMPTK